eukprot:COSAG06_NODE_4125_length_4545_cov_30.309862_4_plen_99_part_00
MVDVTTRLLLADTDGYPDPYLDPAGTGVSWRYFHDTPVPTAETLNTNDVKRLIAAADAQRSGGGAGDEVINVELAMTGKAFAVLLSSVKKRHFCAVFI